MYKDPHNKRLIKILYNLSNKSESDLINTAHAHFGNHVFNCGSYPYTEEFDIEYPIDQTFKLFKLVKESMNMGSVEKELFIVFCELLLWMAEYFGP